MCLPLTWDVCWASSGPEPYPLGLVAPRPPVEKKIGLKRQKKMSSALLSLSRSVQELTEENQSLKEDLDRMLSNSPTASKIKGTCPERGPVLPRPPRWAALPCATSLPWAKHGPGPRVELWRPLQEREAAPCHQPAMGRARSWALGRAVEARAAGGVCPVSSACHGPSTVLGPRQSCGSACRWGRLTCWNSAGEGADGGQPCPRPGGALRAAGTEPRVGLAL